jgi:hypothetical protein
LHPLGLAQVIGGARVQLPGRSPAAGLVGVCGLGGEGVGQAAQARSRSAVPASAPRAAASRSGRQARSTSSISPPLFSVAATARFHT